MPSTAFLAPLAGSQLVRRAADAVLVRYAHHRTVALDRMDAGQVQHDTLLRLVRTARDTRFGRDHDFARIALRRRLPGPRPRPRLRVVLEHLLEGRLPALDDVTWPGKIPYYAALLRHHERGDEVHPGVAGDGARRTRRRRSPPSPCSATPTRRRSCSPASSSSSAAAPTSGKQADGSLAGDLSGIAAKEIARVPAAVHVPAARTDA